MTQWFQGVFIKYLHLHSRENSKAISTLDGAVIKGMI